MPDDQRLSIAHLLRRTGFGPTAAEVDAATAAGYDATVNRLLDFSGPDAADAVPAPTFAPFQPLGARKLTVTERKAIAAQRASENRALVQWWLARMTTTSHPLREKLTWYWHDHFATSIEKVQRAQYMADQNNLLRANAAANFENLTQAVAKDPAMLVWLDAATNVAAHPNENFARELMELFTLGIGNYSETDVKEAARAFTGWRSNPRTQQFIVNARLHDSGTKTVLGQTGPWGGEDVIHIVTNHPASAPYVTARLWSHFAYPVLPDDPVVEQLAPSFAADHDIAALVRSMLMHPQFVSDQARNGLVKQPVEWAVGAARALGVHGAGPRLAAALRALGQVPFAPPNVGGWGQNQYWLTTASMLARLELANALAATAQPTVLGAVAASQRVDAAAHVLSVSWGDSTRQALSAVSADPHSLMTLALVSPEYTLA